MPAHLAIMAPDQAMIHNKRDPIPLPDDPGEGPAKRLAGLGLIVLWTTGADPDRDELFRLQALKREPFPANEWRALDLYVAPRHSENVKATRRMQREFGVTSAQLEGAPSAEVAWAALAAFMEGGPVLVLRREQYETWAKALDTDDNPFDDYHSGSAELLALDEFRGLLLPGRVTREYKRAAAKPGRPDPWTPEALLQAFTESLAQFAALPSPVLSLAGRYLADVARGIRDESRAASALIFALTLVEHPSAWARLPGELFDGAIPDGCFSAALGAEGDPEIALNNARPAWHMPFSTLEELPSLPPIRERTTTLSKDDLRKIEEIFQVHLPAHFAGDGEASFRKGQMRVATEIAEGLGKHELLLAHAPTGTGKTLAYLIPLCLWAARQELRVGVATFTRALQDQAMEREVPLALLMLAKAGLDVKPLVVRLKGRNNSLCWRAMCRMAPVEEGVAQDTAQLKLAWTTALLFGATSEDGDLDAFPLTTPLPFVDPAPWQRARARLLRQVRAETGCCSSGRDRSTCGAEVARRRAERANVVIANHSFALARQQFFRHVIFDECEHLHNQAKGAWSHEIDPADVEALLEQLYKERTGRGPLADALGKAPDGSAIRGIAEDAMHRIRDAGIALKALKRTLASYRTWRDNEVPKRDRRELHGLFREYIEEGPSEDMIKAHRGLVYSLSRLDAALSGLLENIEELPSKKRGRIRNRCMTGRLELLDANTALDAWLPQNDNAVTHKPILASEVFYDVDFDQSGSWRRNRDAAGPKLVARVLLPQEDLGMRYLPELESAVLISATTWIKGSFDASSRYLGLTRAAEPREDEDREPRQHGTLFVPEIFDYSRVLVGVPRDAPAVGGKDAFLNYTTKFLAHLAERTRGRILVLFTNGADLKRVGEGLENRLVGAHIPVYWQGMGIAKEELAERFRERHDSVLLGLDTFWYGSDFPGETLEYLVIVRLPFGVPDDYHHAQTSTMGSGEQRNTIYMPRALARFRQGFGRLMRRESDKGCVFILDKRVLEPRQRAFLRELPTADLEDKDGARLVQGETDFILHEAFAHMEMLPDIRRRGLESPFKDPEPASKPYTGPDPGEDDDRPAFFPSEGLPF
jgi:ATP-dependent DNA helicase DinG